MHPKQLALTVAVDFFFVYPPICNLLYDSFSLGKTSQKKKTKNSFKESAAGSSSDDKEIPHKKHRGDPSKSLDQPSEPPSRSSLKGYTIPKLTNPFINRGQPNEAGMQKFFSPSIYYY